MVEEVEQQRVKHSEAVATDHPACFAGLRGSDARIGELMPAFGGLLLRIAAGISPRRWCCRATPARRHKSWPGEAGQGG